jgi:hypothetical protein
MDVWRRVTALLTVVGLVGAAPRGAMAAGAEAGLAVRARDGGLAFIAGLVQARLPQRVDLPPLSQVLFDCPFTSDDVVAQLHDGNAAITWQKVALAARDGALELNLLVDVDGHAALDVAQPYACFGHAACSAAMRAQGVAAKVVLPVASGPNGRAQLGQAQVTIDLAPEAVMLDLSGCLLGEVASQVFSFVRGWVVPAVRAQLEQLGANEVQAYAQTAVNQLGSIGFEQNGLSVSAQVGSISLAATSGLTLAGDATVLWTGPPASCIQDGPAPPSLDPEGPALPADYGPGQFAIAGSEGRLTAALHEVWRAGWLCIRPDELPTLSLDAEGLSERLGLPAGSQVSFEFHVDRSPGVELGRAAPDQVELRLTGARMDMRVSMPDGTSWPLRVTGDGVMDMRPRIDPELGALVVELTGLSLERLDVDSSEAIMDVDHERMRLFMRDVVVPMLDRRLRRIPLAPAVWPVTGFYALTKDMQARKGWMRVALDMFSPPASDAQPPRGHFVDAPDVVPAGMAVFEVAGTDDATPPPLLRFTARLDGQPLGDPSFIHAIRVSAKDGEHELELVTVDLSGKTDVQPPRHRFVIDGSPPTMGLTDGPAPTLPVNDTHLAWWAQDDRTPIEALESRWELRKVTKDGKHSSVVAGEPFAAGRWEAQLRGLSDDTLYVVAVVVRDRAGNVASAERGFAVRPGAGGCVAASAHPRPGAGAILLGLVAVVARLRRRRQCG